MKSIAAILLAALLGANGQQVPSAVPPAVPQTTAVAPPAVPANPPPVLMPPAAPQTTVAVQPPPAVVPVNPQPQPQPMPPYVQPQPQPQPQPMPPQTTQGMAQYPLVPTDPSKIVCDRMQCAGRVINITPANNYQVECKIPNACSGTTFNINAGYDPKRPGYITERIDVMKFVGQNMGTTINIVDTLGFGVRVEEIYCETAGACVGMTINAGPGVDLSNMQIDCQEFSSCQGCKVNKNGVTYGCESFEAQGGGYYGYYPGYPAPQQPAYPSVPQQPVYPQMPQQPVYPQQPAYPQYPQTPTYPQVPQQPVYPQYPQQPTYPQYPQYQGQPQFV